MRSDMGPGLPPVDHADVDLGHMERPGDRPLALPCDQAAANIKYISRSQLGVPVLGTMGLSTIPGPVKHVLGVSTPAQVLWPAVVKLAARAMPGLLPRWALSCKLSQDESVDRHRLAPAVTVKSHLKFSCGAKRLPQYPASAPADVCQVPQAAYPSSAGHLIQTLVPGNRQPVLHCRLSVCKACFISAYRSVG